MEPRAAAGRAADAERTRARAQELVADAAARRDAANEQSQVTPTAVSRSKWF
jgi:hypothetical protein